MMDVGGLSPRVRGNPASRNVLGITIGSIPAGAGEPLRDVRKISIQQVYPRGCGGTNAGCC